MQLQVKRFIRWTRTPEEGERANNEDQDEEEEEERQREERIQAGPRHD